MIIECPYCETRFRLNERALGGKRPTLRCSQCKRTFSLPGQPPIRPPEDEDELTWDEPAEPEVGTSSAPENDDRQFSIPMGGAPPAEDEPQPSLFETPPPDEDEDESWFAPAPETHPPDAPGTDPEQDEVDDAMSGTIQTRPILLFLALVVAGYGLFASTLRDNPDWTTNLIRQIPVLGDELRANRLGEDIELRDLRGRYERTKEGKLIFVVTGKASNQHDEAVRGIRVGFQLLDTDGKVVADQSTTCGNAMRVELVRDLTIQQVAILRGWGPQPPTETDVRPGDDCPLVSIFLDVPESITDYSAEVLQARRAS